MVIVGAGWIGLEAAAAARTAGSSVTVVEPPPGALHGVLGPELARKFADLHRAHGVDFRFGESAAEFLAEAPGPRRSGRSSPRPARSCPPTWSSSASARCPTTASPGRPGLSVDNGVVSDSALRTVRPGHLRRRRRGQLATCRCSAATCGWSTGPTRSTAARRRPASMLGQQVEYNRVPYFYTDQYDLGMEYSGLPVPGGYDQVVYRGDADAPGVHRVLAQRAAGWSRA